MNFILSIVLSCLLLFSLLTGSEYEEKNYPVGELGSAWQFPSDHLPVGGTIGNIHFVLWNILDTTALHHIVENSQGLKGSLIMTANIPAPFGSLTVREEMIVEDILSLIHHPTHPRSVLALQETSEEMFKRLQEVLPPHMKLFPERGRGDVFIYDTRLFDFMSSRKVSYTMRHNTMMTLTLMEKETGLPYRFIQSHVPGGPVFSAPARQQFADYVMEEFDPHMIIIMMGDMNRSPAYFLTDFKTAAHKKGLKKQPFSHMEIPYPTHINTHQEASWIDNVFFFNPYADISQTVAEGSSELLERLQPILELLRN